MKLWSQARAMLRGIVYRRADAGAVEEELSFHLETHASDLMEQGMPEYKARRLARVELGLPRANGAEIHRRAIGLGLLDDTVRDLRYGLRGLWRNKGFALTAILSLAIGIGATTAMFSVVYAVLLDVYPYADSDRTVNPIVHDPGVPDDWNWFVMTPSQFAAYKAAPCFEDAFAQAGMSMDLDEGGIAQPLRITLLSGNAWSFNNVPALLGRTLQPSDGDIGGKPGSAVVLRYRYWKSHYFSDRSVLGRDFKAGTNIYRIVGVMPERFTLGGAADMYMPISTFPIATPRYIAFAKLKRGVTAAQASEMLDPMIHAFARQDPTWYPKTFHVRLQYLLDGFTSRSKLLKNFPFLYLAVGALLLIGCANCSLLLLARGTTRMHEFALRAAVGASHARMVRQLLVECMAISLMGSVLGTGLAYFLARLPLALAADLFPTEAVVRVNLPILSFSIGTAVLAGLFFGLLPALKFSRPHIAGMLNASGRRTATSGSKRPLQALIATQIALTLVLLTLSAAAVGGFLRVMRMPLGYDPSNTLALYAGLLKDVGKTWEERVSIAGAMQNAIALVPGVVSTSISDDFPPQGGNESQAHFSGDTEPRRNVHLSPIGPRFFETVRTPLLRGRMFTNSEWQAGLPLAVVNQAFVRRFSSDRDVIGRKLLVEALDSSMEKGAIQLAHLFSPVMKQGEVQIVGVVADAINEGMDKPVAPDVYVVSTTAMWPYFPFLVRTQGNPHQYEVAIVQALKSVGTRASVRILPTSLQEMVEHETAWRTQRLLAVLLTIFASGALALALVGIYSVVAYVVAQRRSELGIRLALGASRKGILLLVLRESVLVVSSGVIVGLLLSLIVRARFAAWSEYSSHNPLVMVGAAAALTAMALSAGLVPALRASRMQLTDALRAE